MSIETCPLVEIVHFHKVLRKEMESVLHNTVLLVDILNKKDELLDTDIQLLKQTKNQFVLFFSVFKAHASAEDETIWPALRLKSEDLDSIHEVLEDHTTEEDRFQRIGELLRILETVVNDVNQRSLYGQQLLSIMQEANSCFQEHLEREEKTVHPLIQKHMNKEEIEKMVGQIMGHRSSDIMEVILKMMVRNLSKEDKDFMLGSMQSAVKDTYFEKWLSFLATDLNALALRQQQQQPTNDTSNNHNNHTVNTANVLDTVITTNKSNISKIDDSRQETLLFALSLIANCNGLSELEKEKVISALQSDVNTLFHVNPTVDQLANKRNRDIDSNNIDNNYEENKNKIPKINNPNFNTTNNINNLDTIISHSPPGQSSSSSTNIEVLSVLNEVDTLPTYRPMTSTKELGCKHYKRSCKLISPCCQRAFTCRFCHDEHYENGHNLDRFAVTHIQCMSCQTVQRSTQQCRNPQCNQIFAKYFCPICSLYDDDPNHLIYHCPYCNVCRKGKGLGIDFVHCMKCNACVNSSESHVCISHSIESACPVCQRNLFDSTDSMIGHECGHVMHLLCYMNYRRTSKLCPICRQIMRSEH